MRKLTIAQLQFQIKYDDIRANLDQALQLADQAITRGHLDFIVLPEMWSTGFIEKSKLVENIDSTDYILQKFAHLAKKSQCHVICGSLPEQEGGQLYNTSFLINDLGSLVHRYRKHKLFPLMNEPALFSPGAAPSVIKTRHGKLGLTICYDLRFPDLFQQLRRDQVEIVFLQAQFPAPRVEHWITLLKARAIENQIFLVGTNAVGAGGPYDFFGRSLLINPWGDILADGGERQEAILTTIDLDEVAKTRDSLPMAGF